MSAFRNQCYQLALREHEGDILTVVFLTKSALSAQRTAADNADHLAFFLQLCELEPIKR